MTGTLVFIPAWNEEQNIAAVIQGLHGELPEADVLVVDDGSTDQTAAVARVNGAEVLSLGRQSWPARSGSQLGLPLGARPRLRLLRTRGCRRAASSSGARALAGPCVRRRVRRRGRITFRVGRRLRALPLSAEPNPTSWHSTASSSNGTRPPTAVRRRHERALCRQCEGAAVAGRAVQDRGSGDRSPASPRRRGPSSRRGAR